MVLFAVGYLVARHTAGRFATYSALGRGANAPERKTGADMAAEFLVAHDIHDVQIRLHNSVISDYYDPSRRALFLRSEVHDGKDLCAWAVALHEAAHALNDEDEIAALKWRRTCISLNRFMPVLLLIAAIVIIVVLKRPARIGITFFGLSWLTLLGLNLGTLGIEYRANKQLIAWLEMRLARYPSALEKIQTVLGSVATREVGDILDSPRYFFLSALPGTSRSR
jgi:uncharacterized protein